MRKIIAFLFVVMVTAVALSSCSRQNSKTIKENKTEQGNDSIAPASTQKKEMNIKEKIARGLPNPEFGSIYLYVESEPLKLQYNKLLIVKKTPEGGAPIIMIKLHYGNAYYITYDMKDPRDLYQFYHLKKSDDGTGYKAFSQNGVEEVPINITPFKSDDGNNTYYVIEIPNMVNMELYGVKKKDNVEGLYDPSLLYLK